MKCENCNSKHSGKYGSGRFCSNVCARSFSTKRNRKTINRKISNALKGRRVGGATRKRNLISRPCVICGGNFESWPSEISHKQTCGIAVCKSIHRSNVLKGKCGGYRHGSNRYKHQWYTSPSAGKVYLDSSWEVAFAKHLDEQRIQWIRNEEKFSYLWEGKTLNYIPDFYIVDENEFVEIKGYVTEKDKVKWKYFPKKLRIIGRSELKQLGIIV